MNITTAMASTLASRCLRKIVPARLRTLGPPFRPPGAAMISGLRSAVSLTSLIPNPAYPAASPYACVQSVIPRHLGDSLSLVAQVNRRGPAISSVPQSSQSGQTEIAPVCLMYAWFFVEPSYRLGVAVYGSTLPLTTNFRPVSVVGGE